MGKTAVGGVMLSGAWIIYLMCRWALTHFNFNIGDSDRVALAFLGGMTFLLLFRGELRSRH
jgi:hypothetical protein